MYKRLPAKPRLHQINPKLKPEQVELVKRKPILRLWSNWSSKLLIRNVQAQRRWPFLCHRCAEDDDNKWSYHVLPKHWKEEHVVACLVRHLMIVDGEVVQGEMDWMAKTAEDYSMEGVDVSGVWDGVDDDILKIFPVGSKKSGEYHNLVSEAINYVDQNFDHEKKQTKISV